MKKISILTMLFLFVAGSLFAEDEPQVYLPWQNGKLQVSDNGRYLQHENGTPFFWMGETGWLLPEKLNRDEAAYYLTKCREAGYNVVQVQTVNAVPAMNFSSESRQAKAAEGKTPQRLPSANLLDPSARTATVKR